jgi:hypothetical protein
MRADNGRTDEKMIVYTLANIRTERPSTIKVRAGKKILDGRISGWLLDFPIVTFGEHGQAEFSAETLVHCLNNNSPVRI